jgi:glycosyltransferase involved in cell wall biosynthesis
MNTKVNMHSSPALSIVVPAYNAERFIQPCLDSILVQMEARHELIVVDDGSRDRTGELAERTRREHGASRISIIHQPNAGISGARNRALAAARGDYILFVDADDMLLPGALAALDAATGTGRPDVVACDFDMWRPDKPAKNRRIALGYPADALLEDRDAILRGFFADRHMYVWANVFRREIYARQPQPLFPPGRAYEDVAVLAQLLAQCRRLYRVARPVIGYRQHPASLTRAISPKWCRDFACALRQVRQYFDEHPASDPVRMQIDVAACHFYLGIVKNSYQLPWRAGAAARDEIRPLFLDSLFHHPLTVLAAMERGAVFTRDRRLDAAVAGQVRKALAGSLAFGLGKAASRTLKRWRRLAA